MGAACVHDDDDNMRDASERAGLFSKFIFDNIWDTKEASSGPCPPELAQVIMYDDLSELSEAIAHLGRPCEYGEIVLLYKALKRRKSRKPTGVGYEVWIEVLSTLKGRLWLKDAIDAALNEGNLPSDASLVAVIPGYKGKGIGGGS